jgi:hypothetical protein
MLKFERKALLLDEIGIEVASTCFDVIGGQMGSDKNAHNRPILSARREVRKMDR